MYHRQADRCDFSEYEYHLISSLDHQLSLGTISEVSLSCFHAIKMAHSFFRGITTSIGVMLSKSNSLSRGYPESKSNNVPEMHKID